MTTDLRPRSGAPTIPKRFAKLPSLEPYLGPDRAIRALGEVDWARIIRLNFEISQYRGWPDAVDRIRRDLARVPNPATLLQVMGKLDEALAAKPDREVVSVAVALLFDSQPREPANPEIYLSALIYDLVDMAFPPAVVVAACQHLRREQVFVPAIAEILAACTKLHSSYRATRSLAERAWNARADAEAALEDLAKKPPAVASVRGYDDPNRMDTNDTW